MNKIDKFFIVLSLFASIAYKAEAFDYCCQDICCENQGSFFLRGDVLYWNPHISGLELDFGTGSIAQTTNGDTQIVVSEEIDLDPHFNWNTGYRVGSGYEFSNNFEVGALWTHFQGKGHHRNFDELSFENSGRFRVKFNQIDVALGLNYNLNENFTVKPFLGVRGTKIKDSLNGVISTEIAIAPDVLGSEIRFFDHKQDYCAIGPLIGLQGDWNVGCGFGFYGTAAASLLYGKYKLHINDITFLNTLISNQLYSSNAKCFHSFDGNIDLCLGIFWKTNLFECFEIDMRLGFEHHEYFNQSHLGVYRGDLSFSGGVFSLGVAL